MKPVSVTVERLALVDPEVAFDAIVPVDLASIFTGLGPLPAVKGTAQQVGDWDAAGNTRMVLLSGGATMAERLTDVRRPDVCAYEVTPQRGPLGLIVHHIDGQFAFAPADSGSTRITWTYSFAAKRGRRAAVVLLAPLWRRYAKQVVARCADAAEKAGRALPIPAPAAPLV